MAVNEKAVYANRYVTHAGRIYAPGQPLTGRGGMPDYALQHAQENGLTTESHAEAERAKGAEMQRREDVNRQIADRSEKRDSEKRVDRRR